MTTRRRPMDRVEENPKLTDEDLFAEGSSQKILIRRDGYYWQLPDGDQEFGPFETLELAQADMASGDDEVEPLVGETLQEAENEIGIADWIDPETGQPAEGQSRPHLEAE
jgi:hypothetical protein